MNKGDLYNAVSEDLTNTSKSLKVYRLIRNVLHGVVVILNFLLTIILVSINIARGLSVYGIITNVFSLIPIVTTVITIIIYVKDPSSKANILSMRKANLDWLLQAVDSIDEMQSDAEDKLAKLTHKKEKYTTQS
jgi:hypothetical protein